MCEHRVLLKTLNHPFLVKLHFSFQTKDRLYLVLDYACGGEVCLLSYLPLSYLTLNHTLTLTENVGFYTIKKKLYVLYFYTIYTNEDSISIFCQI